MDASDNDWKRSVGFPINYNSDQSSGDDFDAEDVVMRHPHRHRTSGYLLADGGDGAPADLLGTTPPRARIRNKEKRRSNMDGEVTITRLLKANSKSAAEMNHRQDPSPQSPEPPERLKKRASMKMMRNRERDFKMDISNKGMQEGRADSLPPSNATPAVPTLVESCNRFMSLTSKLKCNKAHNAEQARGIEEAESEPPEDSLLQSRVNFHGTFSMLIKMGNVDKSCRRTISLEEQVWQNELKDLIWLELQAKLAGRTLAQQDTFLCAQRNIVPVIVQNIIDYRFVSSNSCSGRSSNLVSYPSECSGNHSSSDDSGREGDNGGDETYQVFGCLSFNCLPCTDGIGKALKEVGTLLDSFYNAEALYPSSKVMASHHPLVATHLFNNRLKAMCLWYNVALHMRMRILAVRRLILAIQHKRCAHRHRILPRADADTTSSEDTPRPCTVRFDVNNKTPNESSNSDTSSNGDVPKNKEQEPDKDCSPNKERDKEDRPPQLTIDANCGDGDNDGKVEGDGCDEVDRAGYQVDMDKLAGGDALESPEVRNGTVDTTASSESGYLSDRSGATDCPHVPDDYDVYNMGPLKEVIVLKLLKKCEVSPYRDYHYEVLKTQGVRRSMLFINKMRKKVLRKVYLTFERLDEATTPYPEEESEEEAKVGEENNKFENAKEMYELRRYGCWSEETLQMRLPSYRSHFLLLTTICMETVHDYLSLRLDTQPANPSCLTVKQLIHELKEGIDIATEMRNAFVRNIDAALGGYGRCGAREDLQRIIDTFDATLHVVLKQYLSYLTTMSEVEHMPRVFLEAEWCFSARLAQRMRSAAAVAPHSFTDIVCNQIARLLNQFKENFTTLLDQEENYPDESEDIEAKRHFLYGLCRSAQHMYAHERELTLQTVQFARLLATRLRRDRAFHSCRDRIFNSLMSIRECIALHTASMVKKTRLIPWEEELAESLQARLRELILQFYKLGFELHKELHKMAHGGVGGASGAGGRQAPPPRRPASLQPRPRRAPAASRRRPDTIYVNHAHAAPFLNRELHRFVNDSATEKQKGHQSAGQKNPQTVPSPPKSYPNRRHAPVSPPKANRTRLMRSESIGGEDYDIGVFDDIHLHSISSIDNYAPETRLEDPCRLWVAPGCEGPEGQGSSAEEVLWQQQVSRAIIDFAKCWMQFVMERCDRGRGLRPRWASQGLEFLMLACDPYNTKHLSDEEFEELKSLMDACISHVIGSRAAAAARSPDVATPPPRRRHAHHPHHPHHRHRVQSPAAPLSPPSPPSPPVEPEPLLNFHIHRDTVHQRRVLKAIVRLDSERDEHLRESRAVGRVVEAAVSSYEPKLRQVTFKWQRGLKIGAGTFGKVYTVVNTESGQLMAMKELSIGAGDRRAMQRAANELRVLEGVTHPHLVQYYGCELHREEMLLFMELCVEGSLEALLARSALPETQVRRYTRQLVSAVHELHHRQIAHRDIKSGNVFLTDGGHCLKLGDFGCAVKIRANTTAAGELQGQVGTQAYMAPEVFMKSSGHGRAADIWSLGCVVTEMASGKRPFSEYDSNYQIMFVVGMGGRPEVPTSLSHEGQQFCVSCLTHDPDLRPRAAALLEHHFLMVKSDEDCN